MYASSIEEIRNSRKSLLKSSEIDCDIKVGVKASDNANDYEYDYDYIEERNKKIKTNLIGSPYKKHNEIIEEDSM